MEIVKSNQEIVKGKPKSGRIWKTEHNKFSNLVMQNSQRTSWDKKMQMKRKKKLVIEKEKEMKEEAKQKRIALHERQKLNEKRRLENERKAEVVQVIKDPRKIKKTRKKQLRLEKRDLSKLNLKNQQ